MKTIQITIDDSLLQLIDNECGDRNRSAFFRQAAETLLKQLRIRELERKEQAGYKRYPIKSDEFDIWQSEQVWTE